MNKVLHELIKAGLCDEVMFSRELSKLKQSLMWTCAGRLFLLKKAANSTVSRVEFVWHF
jgi:hypothetical protein